MTKDLNNDHYYRRSANGKVLKKHSSISMPYKRQHDLDSHIRLDKDELKIKDLLISSKNFVTGNVSKLRIVFNKKFGYAVVAIFAIGVSIYFIPRLFKDDEQLATGSVTNLKTEEQVQSAIVENAKPEYSILSPSGAGLDKSGGLVKISPKDEKPVYTFKDKLDGSEIVINQQLMPRAEGKSSEEIIAVMANQLKAKKEITVGDIKAYLAEADYGPQQVIFNKANLLVQITSDRKIEDPAWIKYISTLKF